MQDEKTYDKSFIITKTKKKTSLFSLNYLFQTCTSHTSDSHSYFIQ